VGNTGAGAGTSNSISGSAVTYSQGGDGNSGPSPITPAAVPANVGRGGHGGVSQIVGGTQGGSGVVILRYPDTFPLATATTGSPTVTNPTGYRVYTFTASGSITF
jgi:hypothetical protein